MLKPDVFVYTDKTMTSSIVDLRKQKVISTTPKYSMIDPSTQQELGYLQFNDFKSYFVRWHINVFDNSGNSFGYIQETSSFLAVVRRWVGAINGLLELILAFVPQTFDIYYAPSGSESKLVGRITHRKNPFLVKMGLDLSEGQTAIDPRINLCICTLLCLRDINKNS